MRTRVIVFSLLTCLAVAIGSPSANAVTLVPGGFEPPVIMVAGENYSYATTLDPNESFAHQFNFGGSIHTLTTATVLSPGGTTVGNFGVKNVVVNWYDSADNLQGSLAISDGSGVLINPLASLALTLGSDVLYYMVVSGQALSGGGIYNVNVAATPLPPALMLFGTGLAGLAWLGRRRRARRALA